MPEIPCRTRRRWSVEFKRQVVSEASAPGISVSAVARRYDLNANQVFNWRRRYGVGGVFLPVAIAAPARSSPDGAVDGAVETMSGEIEVSLRSGFRVRIAAHVLAAERLHGDDTTVPVLAKGKTRTGRVWTYVRDDAPFGAHDPPAALFHYSCDRSGEHPERHLTGYGGILQADAYAGFNRLADAGREPGPLSPALCWSHGRRKFFELADLEATARKRARGNQAALISPLALEAVQRIDAIFDIERDINAKSADERLAVRRERSSPLVTDLEIWMREQRARLSRHAPVAKAMDYMLKRWDSFTLFLGDGRICLTNNAAERALRGLALGRKSWLFAGSDRGGDRAAFMYTLIVTAKMNDIDPQAWLADVLARIARHPTQQLDTLLPWNWKATAAALAA